MLNYIFGIFKVIIMTNSIVVREYENAEIMLQYATKVGFKEVLIGFGESDIFLKDNYENKIEHIKKIIT